MQLKIKTDKFKEMVSKAVKGAGSNKIIPVTSLMAIELKDSTLTITTTDATNYLYVKEEGVEGSDFYVVVPVDVFSKLIAKTTSETITLTLTSKMNVLKIKGNGTYSIELPMDENGGSIQYPNPVAKIKSKVVEKAEIHLSTIRIILNSIKPILATSLENPCYTGYYVGDKVIGTDCSRIALMDNKISDTAMLISPETMNLLSLMTSEKVAIRIYDNFVVFESPNCVVYSTKMEGLEEFNHDGILQAAEISFTSVCKIPKLSLLQVLDRIALFVSPYDKNFVQLVFTEKGLQVSSKAESGVEIIPFLESEEFKNFSCFVDITMFLSQIKAQTTDALEIHYGSDNSIKMVDGSVIQLIALAVEREEQEEEEE